jgi:asparagine synthetase B (glutamine-hydrolysing)
MLFLETRFFLADHNLAYTDKMSMATGVEVRVPLVDYEVVRFASTIPAGLKQRRSIGKWVLKRAVEKRVPREVIERPKTGFGVPLRALHARRRIGPCTRDIVDGSRRMMATTSRRSNRDAPMNFKPMYDSTGAPVRTSAATRHAAIGVMAVSDRGRVFVGATIGEWKYVMSFVSSVPSWERSARRACLR